MREEVTRLDNTTRTSGDRGDLLPVGSGGVVCPIFDKVAFPDMPFPDDFGYREETNSVYVVNILATRAWSPDAVSSGGKFPWNDLATIEIGPQGHGDPILFEADHMRIFSRVITNVRMPLIPAFTKPDSTRHEIFVIANAGKIDGSALGFLVLKSSHALMFTSDEVQKSYEEYPRKKVGDLKSLSGQNVNELTSERR